MPESTKGKAPKWQGSVQFGLYNPTKERSANNVNRSGDTMHERAQDSIGNSRLLATFSLISDGGPGVPVATKSANQMR